VVISFPRGMNMVAIGFQETIASIQNNTALAGPESARLESYLNKLTMEPESVALGTVDTR